MEKDIYKSIGNQIRAARESLGLSQEQLALQIGYASPATISHFESGARKISIADLQALSTLLGVPVEHFLTANADDSKMRHFRLRASTVHPASREIVAYFLSFAEKHSEVPQKLSTSIRELKPSRAAKKILEMTKIQEPPVSPFEVSKRLGVPVFQWDFPDEISGLFALEGNKACIGVNQNHAHVRQRFSVAHELGHFIFHDKEDLFVDFKTEVDVTVLLDGEQQRLETTANQFAADLLMPFDWVQKDFKEYGVSGISVMAQKYVVSEQALWFRLMSMKLVDRNTESK